MVTLRLMPNRFGLGLHPVNRVKNRHRPVQYPQGPFHLGEKIHMTRGINDVNLVIPPPGSSGGALDSYSPRLFLFHPVHDSFAIVHLADAMALARVVKDPFGSSSFSRVDMGHDADIPHRM
jgi:hypothetical protein